MDKIDRLLARWYSLFVMPADVPIHALLCALVRDLSPAAYLINRLQPEALCFFAPEASRALIEEQIQSHLVQLPRRWEWVVTPEPEEFPASYEALAHSLPSLLETWGVQPGELVLSFTDGTPAMVAALMLVGQNTSSRVIHLLPLRGDEGAASNADQTQDPWRWIQTNPWDAAAANARRDACTLFNRGEFAGAAHQFRQLERRVSGGLKPLYHAFGDLSEGYGLWSRLQYHQAWEKLKIATKSLEMASLWGGPPGLKTLLPQAKANAGFLERLVMDPLEVKEHLTLDLLGHASRMLAQQHHHELVMRTTLRAMESAAQCALFKRHQIKSWDVQPEQLPESLQVLCRNAFLSEVDGRYKLPLHAQFQVLAARGEALGTAYMAQWPKIKPLFDAADHAVLGHGTSAVNPERCQQLYDFAMKLTGLADAALPKFPLLAL